MYKEMFSYLKLKKYTNTAVWNHLRSNILHKYVVSKLKKNIDFVRLSQRNDNDNARKVILLDTPLHENLGDHAITLAEREFISSVVGEENLYEFTNIESVFCLREISDAVLENDIIAIHGGGFLGTLWPYEEESFIRIIECFKEKKIIVFPQTIYFDEITRYGREELVRFSKAVRLCRDITIFTRDRNSYVWLKNRNLLPQEKFCFVPDMVMSYKKIRFRKHKRQKIVWLCLRGDIEKVRKEENITWVISLLEKSGYRVLRTDTVIKTPVNKEARFFAVQKKVRQFAYGSLVITDRLHGMIFSALAETPCIAFDNKSRKVSGGYEWLKHLDYIKCIPDDKLTLDLVLEMLRKKNCKYTNDCLQPYFDLIRNQLF